MAEKVLNLEQNEQQQCCETAKGWEWSKQTGLLRTGKS